MKNNKGFSLVELIIVIAIMAILVGVMAPQLIKYLEKSKESADKTTLSNILTAFTTAASDPDVVTKPGVNAVGSYTVDQDTGVVSGGNSDIAAAATEIIGGAPCTMKSKLGQGTISVEVTDNGAGYTVVVSSGQLTSADGFKTEGKSAD